MRLRVDYWEAMRMARDYACSRKAKGFTMDVTKFRVYVKLAGNSRSTCIGDAPTVQEV